jgi:hypothetical protein
MNARRALQVVVCLFASVCVGLAQHRVDAGSMYSRIYAIVPMVGSGTWDDPKHPMFAPLPQQMTPGNRTGIIAFNHVESDDGTFALIEIVTANRSQLALITGPMTAAAVQGLQIFDRSATSAATVQSAFQQYKKNFDISKFRVVVP